MLIKPTIVIIAYNREKSLNRLLNSLSKAIIPKDVRLVISIDNNNNNKVYELADSFHWPYGDKRVIKHKERQGLRKHVLACGDLTKAYEEVILLEDDLVVSPLFYTYTQNTLAYYYDNEKVAGISLYTHKFNVNVKQRFEPIIDGSDVFWLQFASSWGQAWNKRQWLNFRRWYENNSTILQSDNLPDYVLRWPETSWLKYFIKYVCVTDTYFIYPRDSLTTNCSDVGTHVQRDDYQYQVNLTLIDKQLVLLDLKDSLAIYDSYFEIHPRILKNYCVGLQDYDFDVDLYGSKDLLKLTKKYLLSAKKLNGVAKGKFDRLFWPHDLNILLDNEPSKEKGYFNLSERHLFVNSKISCSTSHSLRYFRGDITLNELYTIFIDAINFKAKRVINKVLNNINLIIR